MKRSSRALPAIVAALVAALASAPLALSAQGPARPWSGELTGRLERIKETRSVRLGFREGAIPFSYLGPDGRPVGYSLDLCHAIVATIAEDLGIREPRIEYVQVGPQDRIERVVSGVVDLECGATTNTAERRQRVAFSPVIFVTGTRLAVPHGSPIRGVADLGGRKVVVARGTTNEAAMREVIRLRAPTATLVVADTYADALALLQSGGADALAADEVLLHAQRTAGARLRDYRIVGEMLSYEPYGIMLPRGDAPLADAVDRTLRALAQSREIVWIYDRWFLRPLPSGQRLDLSMSTQLRRSLELLGLPAI